MIIAPFEATVPVFVGRQPIFNSAVDIYGYELLFRNGPLDHVDLSDATRQVIADGFLLGNVSAIPNPTFFVNFTEKLLLDGTAYAIPPESLFVEILEDVRPTPRVLQALRELKKNGYRIALDDYVLGKGKEEFIKLADVVKVDILEHSRSELACCAEHLRGLGCKLLAEKVEDEETFDFCCDLGFHFYQGYYFDKPKLIPGKKLSSNDISRLKLIGLLSQREFDVLHVVDVVKNDVSLAYRLLRYASSAHFHRRGEIASVERAILLVGVEHLRQWLMATILSDLDQTNAARDLAWISLHRAITLETVARLVKTEMEPESMFLLGLLSRLDAIFGLPMASLLEKTQIDDSVAGALIHGNSWIRIFSLLDEGRWATVEAELAKYGLNLRIFSTQFTKALSTVNAMMMIHQGEPIVEDVVLF